LSKGAKPTIGFVLSLIGGIVIMVAAALYAFVTSAVAIYAANLLPEPARSLALALITPFLIGAYVGLVLGILILLLSILMYTKVNKTFGLIILILGVINIVGSFIGYVGADFFFIGSILSIIGGLLGYMGK